MKQDAFVPTISVQPTDYHHRLRLQSRASSPVLQSIVSPVNGIITAISSEYGSHITSGEQFLHVESSEMKKQYIETIISFLKAKEKLHAIEKKVEHSKLLYASDVISLDSYNETYNTLYATKVDYFQIEHQLKKLCTLMHVDWKYVQKLSLKDSSIIHRMLDNESKIVISADKQGVLLPADALHGAKPSNITRGAKIESGQILAFVGKPNYYEFRLAIDEQDIDYVQVGQHAMIKSTKGNKKGIPAKVVSVQRNPQAQKSSNDPYRYPVVVQAFCEKDCAFHVGSNAKVDIHTHTTKGAIIIPFSSIIRDQSHVFVMKKNSKGTFIKQRIQVSQTTPDGVIVTQGLKKGDTIASYYTLSQS